MSEKAGSGHRVVNVGGRVGGLPATRLLGRQPVDVTLIDRRHHHLFQPLLYQVATGLVPAGQISPALRHVVRKHMQEYHLGEARTFAKKRATDLVG